MACKAQCRSYPEEHCQHQFVRHEGVALMTCVTTAAGHCAVCRRLLLLPGFSMLSAAKTLSVGYVTALWARVRVGSGVHGAQICVMFGSNKNQRKKDRTSSASGFGFQQQMISCIRIPYCLHTYHVLLLKH